MHIDKTIKLKIVQTNSFIPRSVGIRNLSLNVILVSHKRNRLLSADAPHVNTS